MFSDETEGGEAVADHSSRTAAGGRRHGGQAAAPRDLDGEAEQTPWQGEHAPRPASPGHGHRGGQRYAGGMQPEEYSGDAQVAGGGEDDEDTRHWEADNVGWPNEERDGWEQSAPLEGNHAAQRVQPRSVGGNMFAVRRTANGVGVEVQAAPARQAQPPPPPSSPRPPGPPPAVGTVIGGTARRANGGGLEAQARAEEEGKEGEEEEAFEDDLAWGDVDDAVGGGPDAASFFTRDNEKVGHREGFANGRGGRAWSRPPDPPEPTASREGNELQGAPSRSKLVQRVFGSRGRRGRGGGRGRTLAGRGGRDGVGSSAGVRDGGGRGTGGDGWAVQAELQGKLQELEEEVGVL